MTISVCDCSYNSFSKRQGKSRSLHSKSNYTFRIHNWKVHLDTLAWQARLLQAKVLDHGKRFALQLVSNLITGLIIAGIHSKPARQPALPKPLRQQLLPSHLPRRTFP